MTSAATPSLLTLGLFEKRIDGDDALLELAQWQFREAGMGAEMHAGSPDQLDHLLRFRPSAPLPVVLHLPRDFHLLDEACRSRIAVLARRFAGRLHGMVIHDHHTMTTRPDEVIAAAGDAHQRLAAIPHGPTLFVEYAVGIDPADFVAFFTAIRDLHRVSACIDIGHVAMKRAAEALQGQPIARDAADLRKQSRGLPEILEAAQAAGRAGVTTTLKLIEAMVALRKPLHYHLHDGHPLSTSSPYGVWDHLSFLTDVPLSFGSEGPPAVPPVFGPAGLTQIISRALAEPDEALPSFTLEIHPTSGERDLRDAPPLFGHWTDTTNARKMHHWVTVLMQNHHLLRQTLQQPRPPSASRRTTNDIPLRSLPSGLDPENRLR